MIPDYQTLMKPILEIIALHGEIKAGDLTNRLADLFSLSEQERSELLRSGKQTILVNRVSWAKIYLIRAGLLASPSRGYVAITARGQEALADSGAIINNQYLKQFKEFIAFRNKAKDSQSSQFALNNEEPHAEDLVTPDEAFAALYRKMQAALAVELLDRLRSVTPVFFEQMIVDLLLAMGYGGSQEEAGRAIGRSGDQGVDGVIDQDPLGVDQIYIQAKRYSEGNNIGASDIRDFFGALSLKKAQKGIFITTSDFSPQAIETAKALGRRMVLIQGQDLARLMIRYNIGCRIEDTLYIKKIDESFFDQ